jgi:hypothetical protein
MEKKYIIPASTLLTGILIWVIFLIVYNKDEMTLILEVTLGFITGGLLIFSAFRCRKVGGPKSGNIFRASLLFIMAILTYLLVGINAAILLLAASIVILSLALKKSELTKVAKA